MIRETEVAKNKGYEYDHIKPYLRDVRRCKILNEKILAAVG